MLYVHRAERSDVLVEALGGVLGTAVGDPFAPEVVAVPSRGVERWLAQRLSHVLGTTTGEGVCANVLFPSHTTVLDDALAAADPSYGRSVERWSVQSSVWTLLDVLDASIGEPWCRELAVHLGTDEDKGRRYALASKVAHLFSSYGRSRPELLTAWAQGLDGGLPVDLHWQPELWRRLRTAVQQESPAEGLDAACASLRNDPATVRLPERFSIFGVTRLAPARVRTLSALAVHRDLHLWLNHASAALWDAVAGTRPGRRALDRSRAVVAHPLLSSLSRDVRELQQLLETADCPRTDLHHRSPERPGTLLGALQQGLADGRLPVIDADDRSLQVHACHGRARQVEVVREAVLGLLADDPSLEPRDVVIMCPDVEVFAPLVAAAFGMAEEPGGHPAATLRVKVADRALRQTNPMVALLTQLLDLAASRVTSTQLLDLAGTGPVRRRFGFTDDDLERLTDWVSGSGIRWGLDVVHRGDYALAAVSQGTLRQGLDRLLVGVAMEEDRQWLADALPLDDVDSGDIDLAGRFAELVDRVDQLVAATRSRQQIACWVALLEEAVLSLGESERSASWQQAQLRQELAAVAEEASGSQAQLSLADVTALLNGRLQGRPTRASFRTGTLTVCTLVPMRSVPHRVVCLVGLDDGAFPRQSVPDGDDALARDPHTGERDARSEDRQLMLDAICAAQEHLVITYSGADPRTNAACPPAVPLGELLDSLAAMGAGDLVVHHPLQPFDGRNFTAGALGRTKPFSFDPIGFAGAVAAQGVRSEPAPLLTGKLDRRQDPLVALRLDDLVRFLQEPVKGFFRQRLGITTSARDEDPSEELPTELGPLERWAVGDRMLTHALQGWDSQTCRRVEQLRGELPPGPLGATPLDAVVADVDALLRASVVDRAVDPEPRDVSVALSDGRRLIGTVSGVRGEVVLSMTYSRLAPKHRLASWVRHLALVVSFPGVDWRSVTVGKAQGGARRAVLNDVDPATARAVLEDLVAIWDAGLQEPLPLVCKASEAYAVRRNFGASQRDALDGPEKEWNGDRFDGERDSAEHTLLWGGKAPFGVLLQALPTAAEQLWQPEETTRFGVLSRQLWTPLAEHENDVRL